MYNWGLKKTFLILTLVLVLIGIIQSIFLFSNNSVILGQTRQIGNTALPILNKAHELKLSVIQVQQWLTDISATRGLNGLDDGFDEARANAEKFRRLINELSELDPENAGAYKAMLPIFEDYYQAGQQMAKAYIRQGPEGGNRVMGDFDKVAERMSQQVDTFMANTIDSVSGALNNQTQAVESSRVYFIAGSLSIFLGIALLFFVMNNALSALPRAIQQIRQVTEGNLTAEIQSTSKDEIGSLLKSVEALRTTLINIISQITDTTFNLNVTAEQITQATQDTQSFSAKQQSETQLVATAMNEMSSTIQEVVSNISLTADKAASASHEANNGREMINSASSHIQHLFDHLESAGETILQLEQDTNAITAILDVIREVSEQTNLLALNAAIEAARAGEQGRGFAVVADEVRALASRTQKSTEEINHMIEKVLQGSHEAVEVTNACRVQARTAVEQATDVRKALETISTSVAEISNMSSQVATATEEQAAVTEEMNRNIVNIEDMSGQIVDRITAIYKHGDGMIGQSNTLKNMVGQFLV